MHNAPLPPPWRLAAATLLTGLGLGLPASSAHDIDFQEHNFGATHISAQAGNGGLSLALAPRGEVTVLSWPSPSHMDQLDYETSSEEDARERPRLGAAEDEGIFSGLFIEQDGAEGSLSWTRDAEWEHQQSYPSVTSPVIQQLGRRPDLGLDLHEWTLVDPDADRVYRRARVERTAESPVTAVTYLLFENLAPTTERPEDLMFHPVFGADDGYDFAAYYDSEARALVHFAPDVGAVSDLDGLMTQDWGESGAWEATGEAELQELLNGGLGQGVFVAIGGTAAPTSFQLGRSTCSEGAGWTWSPLSAFVDAADGVLSGSPLAACAADGALAFRVDLGPAGTEEAIDIDTYWAVGATPTEALAGLEFGRSEGFDSAEARAEAAATAILDGLHLPDDAGEQTLAFAQRTLLSLAQGTDRDSGAMVASLSTQPPYHHDWPRDSVFFDLALDVSGQFEAVTRHKSFLAAVQNREPGRNFVNEVVSPPGAWYMNFYADGQPTTQLLNPFEIDQVGLMLMGFWAHAAFADNDQERRNALAGVWPAVQRAANLLAVCVDDDHPALAGVEAEEGYPRWWSLLTALNEGQVPSAEGRSNAMAAGLWDSLRPCLANEDDHPAPTVSLYSTHVVRAGLLAAAQIAELLCLEDSVTAYWSERAHELGSTAFALYYTPEDGETPASWEGRGDWLLWPIPLSIGEGHEAHFATTATSPEEQAAEALAFQTTALDAYADQINETVRAALAMETEGAAYINKHTLNLARYWANHEQAILDGRTTANAENIRQLAEELPIDGTLHVGEVWANVDDNADGIYDRRENRTGLPHLWTASLTYLSTMAVHRSDRFTSLETGDWDPVCNSGEEPKLREAVSPCEEGCEESLAGPGNRPTAAGLLALVLVLGRRRRKSPQERTKAGRA